MKKNILLTLLALITLTTYTNAQNIQVKMEKMRSQRVAYITDKVQLTTAEAEHFWPLYNELTLKLDSLRTIRHQAEQDLSPNATNADYTKANQTIISVRKQMATLREEYYKKFQTILSQEKIHRLYVAEQSFRKIVLGDIRKK